MRFAQWLENTERIKDNIDQLSQEYQQLQQRQQQLNQDIVTLEDRPDYEQDSIQIQQIWQQMKQERNWLIDRMHDIAQQVSRLMSGPAGKNYGASPADG